MNAKNSPFIRSAGLLATAICALQGGRLQAGDALKQADAFPTFDSYIKVTGYAPSITGNKAAFQNSALQSENGGAGIEALHLTKDLTKDVNVELDGRALTGSEDYLAQMKLTKNEVGSFEVGYKRFRTFYDGAGGFFPTNQQWMPLANEDLHLDRAKFWVETTIALPDMPVFTIKYTNELRDGQKDSTIWGGTDLTGLPFNLAPNPVNPARKLAPSYIDVGERHQELEATVRHTINKTTVQVTYLHEEINNLDTRYVTNFPGEVIPWSIASLSSAAQPAAKANVAATNWNNQQAITQSDGISSKTNSLTGKADTIINDKLTLRLGGTYQELNADVTGNRLLLTSTPTASGATPVATANVAGLTGSSRIKSYTWNADLDYAPTKDLSVKFAFRGEEEFIHGASGYNVTAASGTPAVTLTTTPRQDWSKVNQHSGTPVLELRYTGIKDLALYFTGSQRNLNGIEKDTSAFNPLTVANGTLANNNISEDHGNYTLGANWRPSSALDVRTELFSKHHQYESAGFSVNLGDYYLLDSQFKGVKFTIIAKPTELITSTTRYIYQSGKMQVTGYLPTYPAFDSADAKNHTFSETVDWVPNKLVYVQASGTLVYNTIGTIYPRAGITVATATVAAYDTNNVLHDSNNNYVTLSALVGTAVDKKTDLQLQATYYRADDGNPALAALTTPYGAAAREYTVTAGIKHKLSNKMVVNAKVGYFDSVNDTTGGNTNFKGPVAYLSLDYAL